MISRDFKSCCVDPNDYNPNKHSDSLKLGLHIEFDPIVYWLVSQKKKLPISNGVKTISCMKSLKNVNCSMKLLRYTVWPRTI